jgi:tetratricopeptide (TPR) repeat protein
MMGTHGLRQSLAGLLVLGLLFSGGALAAKPSKPKPEAPAATGPSMEERTAVFGPVDTAFKEGRKAEVADLLVAITENPAHAAFHAESYARLGATLESLDLPFSALVAYEKGLSLDAPMVADSAKKAIALADKVGDTALLEKVFASNLGLEVDDATRSRMAYLAAREAAHQEKYALALASLKMVQTMDPYFAEAKALEGIALSLSGRHQDALGPLQIALGTGQAQKKGPRFNDLVRLNLARAYFAAGNFPRSMEYYAQVERSSRSWPQSQFERAWSHFRLDDPNGALSLLHAQQSPFMAEIYLPEADLLQIYSLFVLCKFPQASKGIEAFQVKYTPTVELLKGVAAEGPTALFDKTAALVEGKPSDLPPLVAWFYVEEDRFKDSLTAVRSAEDEMKRLQNVAANPFSAWATTQVEARRQALIQAEGARVVARATKMADELADMIAASDLSKLDMMDMEKRLYRAAANTGEMKGARETVQREKSTKKDQRTWPWEGEYWADEVGYYRVNAKPDCPADLQ